MSTTGTPELNPRSTEPMPVVGDEALAPSTEAWIERMMRAGERMHRDEDYRLEIAKRLS